MNAKQMIDNEKFMWEQLKWGGTEEIIVIGLKNSFFRALRDMPQAFRVRKIYDLRIEKDCDIWHGYTVYKLKPDEKDLYDYPILIASDKYEEVAAVLKAMGLFENVNFMACDNFLQIYYWMERGEIRIDNVMISCTKSCTLNCEKCMAFVPYQKDRGIVPLDEMKKDVDAFFAFTDYCAVLRVIGGEPFLNDDVGDLFQYIERCYGNRVGEYEITTNGTVTPKPDVVEKLKIGKLHVHISDYTGSIPEIKRKVAETEETIVNAGIKCVRNKDIIWVDLGFPETKIDISAEDVCLHMRRCNLSCQTMGKQKYYMCGSQYYAVEAGLIRDEEGEYFDLHRKNDRRNKELFHLFNMRMMPEGLTMCKKCAGIDAEYKVEIPAAIQKARK